MNTKHLTFEIGDECNMTKLHPRCPVGNPERYMFGQGEATLTDDFIIDFWQWARDGGFDGVVLWHLYNEPTLSLQRILELQRRMQAIEPSQRFHLWTNTVQSLKLVGFTHVQVTNYGVVRPGDLDNRRATTRGEGAPYGETPFREGRCGRGAGWEVIIDHHGNWLLCCNDWRCEESVGNALENQSWAAWAALYEKYQAKAKIEWRDEASYAALPRMCRACLDVNPNLHRTAIATW